MIPNGHGHRTTPPQSQSHPLPPPPPINGVGAMSLPYDPSRRRSLDAAGSPPQHAQGWFGHLRDEMKISHTSIAPPDALPPPPPFQPRQMPPPSPPQMSSTAPSLSGSAPRGPPTASPFAGVRDLASHSSNRPSGGMSISSILGGNEERRSHGSPSSTTPKSMPPPSPGRVRSSSMREGQARNARDVSPPRSGLGDPKATPTGHGHDRTISEPQREGFFPSPRFVREPFNNFRAFEPAQQEARPGLNGHGPPGRPSSQPTEPAGPRSVEEIIRQVPRASDGRLGTFRPVTEPAGSALQDEETQRRLLGMPPNSYGPPPQAVERSLFPSPLADRDHPHSGPLRFQSSGFHTPRAEEQAGLFRPAFQPSSEPARESIEARQYHDTHRDLARSSPPPSEFPPFDRVRNGFVSGPMGLEDYQRDIMQREAAHRERIQREQQQRKESDGSLHRALFNISPEVNRKGRNSPLPQAVQGAQPRHVGPGGDNPSVKMEFGRMFSGLGSGVGTATPTHGNGNGTMTPSRMTPVRQVEGGDLVRTAVAEIEEGRRSSKNDSRGGRKSSRRFREEEERMNGRETPDHQPGSKRAKTNHASHHHHHHHAPPHHHHHHHQPAENSMPNPFNTIRFPSNPLSNSNLVANNPAHHHHHHHATHAHTGHHHHHPPRAVPPARKPSITVVSKKILESCAKRPRKHLGSQLYSTELSTPPATDTPFDPRIKFSSTMKPIPFFEGKENCTFTVRVPREYLKFGGVEPSYFEEICKRKQLWGSEVYTDDSDVVAAAVHSGWLKGDFGELNEDLRTLCDNDSEREDEVEEVPLTLLKKPRRPVRVPDGHDAHITVLILPPLDKYTSSNQHHILSRDWGGRGVSHDGMSFMIERIEFVNEDVESRQFERNAAGRKLRLAIEESKRKEAAASLVMFAGGGEAVGVGA